ncbi:hypothetical protein OWV82_007590 [Melia azedarach]|uniref:Uncharacterized protein n=1 Tax=Melia azedarach TaxID=155640 RepID=A0ACC1Y8U0_MELAZ|nr:hypothetical protein OWV82_007590 [Melia azedarach]
MDTSVPKSTQLVNLRSWWKRENSSTLDYLRQVQTQLGGHTQFIPSQLYRWNGPYGHVISRKREYRFAGSLALE